jgi:uncharacterized Zn-binding protein involved in type VI secretion
MPVTIDVNGMSMSHMGSMGFEKCSAPDVCKTPSAPPPFIPIPYQIISFNWGLIRGTTSVFADGGNSIDHCSSAHMPCIGDEPGVGGGVISGTFKHESTWITFSPNVYLQGKNAARQGDKMFMNNKNTISGTGGNWEPMLSPGTEPVLAELCKIFCKINNDGKASKDARGKEAAQKNKSVKQAVQKAHGPNANAEYNKSTFHATKKPIAGPKTRPRVNWAGRMNEIEGKLRKKFWQKARQVAGKKALTKAATVWTRAIPIVGWGLAAYDVYDVATTASGLWKEFKKNAIGGLKDKVAANPKIKIYEARPDVMIESKGKAEAIYDFKFGKDNWQPGQKDLYDDILDPDGMNPTKKAVPVSQDRCNCKKSGPSV